MTKGFGEVLRASEEGVHKKQRVDIRGGGGQE